MKELAKVKAVQVGELKGIDQFGNQYYQSYQRMTGKNRWVVYAARSRDLDASQVPPEWHGWLHYMWDETPIENPLPSPKYLLQHQSNIGSQMGTRAAYLPPGHLYTPNQHVTFQSTDEHQRKAVSSYNTWEKIDPDTDASKHPEYASKTERS